MLDICGGALKENPQPQHGKAGGKTVNYYERIQKAINFMEDNLENEVKTEEAAKEAYMSVSAFYRLFFAITGYRAKEYLINRRISQAAQDIGSKKMKVLDAAVKYAYTSPDAFSRTFKNVTGCSPGAYAGSMRRYRFERIEVMEKYFEIPDEEMNEQYPDIKVLKEMPAMRVAYYRFFGRNPEESAFAVMKDWAMKEKLDIRSGNYRIFGYNAPDCDPSAEEYGYEVCVTIPEDLEVKDKRIQTKKLEGGLYAVISIERSKEEELGEGIMRGWKRFASWLEGSKYLYGDAQWLEEHLGFGEELEHFGGVELYMPVKLKADVQKDGAGLEEVFVEPFTVAVCTACGKGAEERARKRLFAWMREKGIGLGGEDGRLFAFYNFESMGKPDFFYKLYVKIPADMETGEEEIKKEVFPGGLYLKQEVKYKVNGTAWFHFIGSMETNSEYGFGQQPFMETYLIDKPVINRETMIAQYMPVVKKV